MNSKAMLQVIIIYLQTTLDTVGLNHDVGTFSRQFCLVLVDKACGEMRDNRDKMSCDSKEQMRKSKDKKLPPGQQIRQFLWKSLRGMGKEAQEIFKQQVIWISENWLIRIYCITVNIW